LVDVVLVDVVAVGGQTRDEASEGERAEGLVKLFVADSHVREGGPKVL
jgi:hypothetical protein